MRLIWGALIVGLLFSTVSTWAMKIDNSFKAQVAHVLWTDSMSFEDIIEIARPFHTKEEITGLKRLFKEHGFDRKLFAELKKLKVKRKDNKLRIGSMLLEFTDNGMKRNGNFSMPKEGEPIDVYLTRQLKQATGASLMDLFILEAYAFDIMSYSQSLIARVMGAISNIYSSVIVELGIWVEIAFEGMSNVSSEDVKSAVAELMKNFIKAIRPDNVGCSDDGKPILKGPISVSMKGPGQSGKKILDLDKYGQQTLQGIDLKAEDSQNCEGFFKGKLSVIRAWLSQRSSAALNGAN